MFKCDLLGSGNKSIDLKHFSLEKAVPICDVETTQKSTTISFNFNQKISVSPFSILYKGV